MFIIKKRKIFYIFSGILVLGSIVVLLVWGLNLGIDFTGGSLLEVEYKEVRPNIDELKRSIQGAGFEVVILQPTGSKGLLVRTKDLTEAEHQNLLISLEGAEELRSRTRTRASDRLKFPVI